MSKETVIAAIQTFDYLSSLEASAYKSIHFDFFLVS
jgi:hypothetical protein